MSHDHAVKAFVVLVTMCMISMVSSEQAQCSEVWSTSALSVARGNLAATSLPNQGLAIFAGGILNTGRISYSDAVDIFDATSGRWTPASLTVARGSLAATSLPNEGLALFAGGGFFSNAVDIFNATSGSWITSALSVARFSLAATSLPNQGLAIFAGGICDGGHTGGISYSNAVDIFDATSGRWSTSVLRVGRGYLAATSLPNQGLAMFAGGNIGELNYSSTVDIFNATSGRWTTSSLSVARGYLAATSLPNQGLAIFAGGNSGGFYSNVVDIFDATSGSWTISALKVARGSLAATSLPDQGLAIFAGGGPAVEIFDGRTGKWGTAALSVARGSLAATSLPIKGLALGLAIFAGGDIVKDSYSAAVDTFQRCFSGCFFRDAICTQCYPGSYSSLADQLSCTLCPAGTSNPNYGSPSSNDCQRCVPPQYSAAGQADCNECPAGSYCPDPANGTRICPVGYYCPAKSKAAVPCEKGFLCSSEGLSQQYPCPSGHYCPTFMQGIPCPAGTFSTATEQTSPATCRPCSSSQSCPEGTSNPTPLTGTNTWQIVAYVLSAICSLIGILVAVFRVWPVINSRFSKLREAGLKPTLKRVIFLDKTLSKYRPLLERSDRADSLQVVAQIATTPCSRTSNDAADTNAASASAIAPASPLLLSLSAVQIGHLVASIGPAYADYRQLIIGNRLTGNFIANNSESDLTFAVEELGICKKLHVHHIMNALMQLKSGDETALATASSYPSS